MQERVEMAATSEEGLETLVRDFDLIYQGYKDAVSENHALQLKYTYEIRRREAIEATCNDLRADNDRLRKTYAESLTKLTNQIRFYSNCQSLKEELQKTSGRMLALEEEHRKAIEMLKEEDEMKIRDLEKQIRWYHLQKESDEAEMKKLKQDLSDRENKINDLTQNLEQITADVDPNHHHEIQELKDWIMVEQEETKQLCRKLQNAENELHAIRSKQAEQQKESVSICHFEALKQKVMKLRKENESLKRQIQGSEL